VTLYAHWKSVFATASTPLIRGTLQVGSTLQADAGSWAPEPALHYGWKRDGADIGGADGSTYDLTIEDLGHTITVTVTASLAGYEDAVRTSAPTATIGAGVFSVAPVPTISGTPRVGVPLTAAAGTWTSGASFAYAWKRSGSTTAVGAADTYTPVTADIGKTLTVTVTATRDGFTALSKTSVATAVVLGSAYTTTPTPTITGTKASGSTLTAVTTGWVPSSGVTFSYVWKRASTSTGTKTTISGATSKTYKLVTADKGKFITVTVTASKTGYASTTKVSADGGTKIAS